MSGVSLPSLDLNLNKSVFPAVRTLAAKTRRHTAPLLCTEQISLLLSLLAIGVYQKAEAQGTNAEQVITAQNNFGEVTQLILSDGKLYILTSGCELQFVRLATAADLAAIAALSPLSLPEAGLDLYLISAAAMAGADISSFCLNSDPVSEFVEQVRYQDEGAISLTGMLAAGLGLLAGLGGGFGGGGGGQAGDQTSLSVTASGTANDAVTVKTNYATNQSYIELEEGRYEDDDDLSTGLSLSGTSKSGKTVSNLKVSDDRFEVKDGALFIKKDAAFDFEDDSLEDISVRISPPPFGRFEDFKGFEVTVTGDDGFSQTLNVVVTDLDDFPEKLSLSADTGVADNTRDSVLRTLATITVDDGDDEEDGGELKLAASTWPTGSSKADAEKLVELSGTTLRLKAGVKPDDMPSGDYLFTISYQAGDDDLIGTPPAPVTFTPTVGDINEQPTEVEITTQEDYVHASDEGNAAAELAEGTSTTGGIKLAVLDWDDEDTGQDPTKNVFSVPQNNDYFEIRNDDELWLKADVSLNHEADDQLKVTITVEDDTAELGRPATKEFTLHITDVDEYPTEFSAPASVEIDENRREEEAVKLADITVRDEDTGRSRRDNLVTIEAVKDAKDTALAATQIKELFEIRAGGTELWLRDPSGLDAEDNDEYTFTLKLTTTGATAGSAPEDIEVVVNIKDTILNADKVETLSLAKLQRDDFALQISDPNDATIASHNFTLEGTDKDKFELKSTTDPNEGSKTIQTLHLKDGQKDSLTAGRYTVSVTVLTGLIKVAIPAEDIDSGVTVSSLNTLDDKVIASEITSVPPSFPTKNTLIKIDIGTDRYIILKENMNGQADIFEAITEAELQALIADITNTKDTFAVVAHLNTDGTILRQQTDANDQNFFHPPESERQDITLVITHNPVKATATSEAEEFIGHADHDNDDVSYAPAGAQNKDGHAFGVKIDLNKGAETDRADQKQVQSYDDLLLGITGISNGWAAGDTLIDIEHLTGTNYRDHLIGNEADNRLTGNAGDDTLTGNAGDDVLAGGSGDDQIAGGTGDDSLAGGPGADSIDGGDGDDTATVSGTADLSAQGDLSFEDSASIAATPVEVTAGTHRYIVLKSDGSFEAVSISGLSGLDIGSYAIVARLDSQGQIIRQENHGGQTFFTSATTKISVKLAADDLMGDSVTGLKPQMTGPDSVSVTDITVTAGATADRFVVLKTDGSFEAVTRAELDALTYGGAVIVARLNADGTIDEQLQNSNADYFTAQRSISVKLGATDLNGDTITSLNLVDGTPHASEITLGASGNNITPATLTIEVGVHRYIILKADGSFEARADLTGLTADEYAIVAVLGTDGTITRQSQDSGSDFFNAPSAVGLAVNLDAADLMGQTITGLAPPDMAGPASLTKTDISVTVGTTNDRFIVMKADGTFEAVTRAELDALTYGEGVIVATLDKRGEITDQLEDSSTDFFTAQPANLVYSWQVNTALNRADLKTNGLSDLAVTTSGGDVLLNIENLIGSGGSDILIGDDQDNSLSGAAGNDEIYGGAGADTLVGGSGNDEIYGGAGADRMTGGSGQDKFELELDDGERAADIITDFTASDRLLITNPDKANKQDISDYGDLKDLLDAASLRLEEDSTDTDDAVFIYNSGQQGASDEVVLILDEFLAENDLDDITLTQFELV